ncbi:hypothetical protein J1780_04630 [Rahnella aceris]|uniref:hypothetical protein n=1 Tax=Rahnella sp. (strain Y9602) TaxID=2703885 RepID=UPI001C257779|nr:hypothetical protein [Rahnella aceris]MBU9839243.1 hypothetical protein [Rahnella aceris]
MTKKVNAWRLPGSSVLAEMLKGILPGLALCLLTIVTARAMPTPETFLPEQDITISGKVTAPSCQARLDTDSAVFHRAATLANKTGAAESKGSAAENKQVISLVLSECDFDGLGLVFKAESLPGFPARGQLRGAEGGELTTAVWYTIGPGASEGDAVLKLSPDSPALDKGQVGEAYFRLNQEEYWFDVSASLSSGQVLNIPFDVLIHYDTDTTVESSDKSLVAQFTLQVSYR